jgi:hypothetical protein
VSHLQVLIIIKKTYSKAKVGLLTVRSPKKGHWNEKYFTIQWKPVDVITLGQRETDNIKQMMAKIYFHVGNVNSSSVWVRIITLTK